ncbi:MAG: cytochrome c biogenesis protein CcsA [Rhodospirillaceae bacterium]|nr:cytochrome c biogenesis protein CcsA [Rhodospirillaceae bacterium]
MSSHISLQIIGLVSLLPLAATAVSARLRRNLHFWMLLLGCAVICLSVFGRSVLEGWQAGFSAALWASMAVSLLVFIGVAIVNQESYRLSALLLPYLMALGLVALLFSAYAEAAPEIGSAAWFQVHVLLALASYGILTVGAIAGLSVLIQERALKRRETGWAERALPPLSAAEDLQIKLLTWAAAFMAAALASGFASSLLETGQMMAFSHKVLLSLLAFAVLVALLVVHRVTGLRGRRAARWVLVGYLLLTLGYPGVKFVKDVLIG